MSHFIVLTNLSKDDSIYERMAPYSECTEDLCYLEFEDCTEELINHYKTDTVEAYQMLDGTFVNKYPQKLSEEQQKILPLIKKCPVAKVYPTLEKYAEYYGYTEVDGKYGYYTNPDAFYDWFSEGGRFDGMFIVKDDNGEYVNTSSARKRDICWDEMLLRERAILEDKFRIYQYALKTGDIPKEIFAGVIKDEALYSWGNKLTYRGQTLDEFLEGHNCGKNSKYAVSCYGFLADDGYHSCGSMGWFGISSGDKEAVKWSKEVQEYIKSIPDEDLLVTLDCHI